MKNKSGEPIKHMSKKYIHFVVACKRGDYIKSLSDPATVISFVIDADCTDEQLALFMNDAGRSIMKAIRK